MPSLHFTSPYGHVKPQLLQALSIKRKKSRVAAVAAAAVFKVFTNTRGKDAILRQGVKYRNMFHAGGGLVRERQPGEEVTPEKGWVTDEESEQSDTEGSEEEAIPVAVKAEDVVERFEVEQEAEVLVVTAEEAEVVANTDLLKLEISLAEKEIPQASVPQAPMLQAKEELVDAEVLSAQESTSETHIKEVVEQGTPAVVLSKEVEQQVPEELVVDVVEQAPEQLIMRLEQVEEQEPVKKAIAQVEANIADAALVPEPLPPTSVMNLLEPAECEPYTFTAVMNVLQPSKPEPVSSMVVETSIPEPFIPMAMMEIADVQQPESILEVKEVEVSPLDDIPGETQEEQEDIKVDDIEQHTEAELQEGPVEAGETKTFLEESSLEDEVVDISPNTTIAREPEVQGIELITQPPLPQSIAEPTLEAKDEELTEEIVEKVLPICMHATSLQPPQETPVLAISEKHSEQLFDEYDETELNEDEEPEVEVEVKNLVLEGS
ncbi:hypothetical protein EV426DRAFT_37963 [Tirmania nivea]|nr:hypothetical protein EV426DRAFT_37963 [Tirmania nivea]